MEMAPPAEVVAWTPSPPVALTAPTLVPPMVMVPDAPVALIASPALEVTPSVSMAIVPEPAAEASTAFTSPVMECARSLTTTLPLPVEAAALTPWKPVEIAETVPER